MRGDGKISSRTRKTRRTWVRRFFWSFLVCFLGVIGVHQYVLWSTWGDVYAVPDAPVRDVIIVLGASVLPDGRPSDILEERLRAAAELYHLDKADTILVSGDHGEFYDEVGTMTESLLANGVPESSIVQDKSGLRTLDSMYRAYQVFGVRSALVVTNPFHVSRAVFLGESAGIDVAGVVADYDVDYSLRTVLWNNGREVCARILAFCDVFLLGTEPQVSRRPY